MTIAFNWHNEASNSFFGPATSLNVGSDSATGSNGTFTAGDFLLCFVTVYANVGTITPPAGWTLIGSQQLAGSLTTGFFYKIAGVSESGSYTFSWTGSNFCAWGLLNYSGGASIDASGAGTFDSGGTTNCTAVSISPTGASDTLIALWVFNQADAVTAPGDMTQRVNLTQESGTIVYLACDKVLSASGATGSEVATQATFHMGAYLMVAIQLPPSGMTFFCMPMMGA